MVFIGGARASHFLTWQDRLRVYAGVTGFAGSRDRVSLFFCYREPRFNEKHGRVVLGVWNRDANIGNVQK